MRSIHLNSRILPGLLLAAGFSSLCPTSVLADHSVAPDEIQNETTQIYAESSSEMIKDCYRRALSG